LSLCTPKPLAVGNIDHGRKESVDYPKHNVSPYAIAGRKNKIIGSKSRHAMVSFTK